MSPKALLDPRARARVLPLVGACRGYAGPLLIAAALLVPMASSATPRGDRVDPRNALTLRFSGTGYSVGAQRGLLFGVEPRLDYALGPLRTSARMPVFAARAEGGADFETGVGDLELTAAFPLLHQRGEHAITLGVRGRLPTGDRAQGLGLGVVGLQPFIEAAIRRGPMHFGVELGDFLTLSAPAGVPRAAPRSSHELEYRAWAGASIAELVSVKVGVLGQTLLGETDVGQTYLSFEGALAVGITEGLWLDLSVGLPLLPARRYAFQGAVSIVGRF